MSNGDGGDRKSDVELPDPFGGRGLPSGRSIAGIGLILLLLIVAVLWFVRPWIHPLVYGVFFRSPGFLQWLLVAGVLAGAGLRLLNANPWAGRAVLGVAVVALLLALAAPVIGGEYANEHLAIEVQNEVTELDQIPDTGSEQPRILPASVAAQYAQNSLQFPRHSIAGGDIAFIDGVPHWSYALQPDGFVNTFVGKQAGAAFVDMTTQSKRVSITEQEFTCGQGQLVTDDYLWTLRKSEYAVDYQDPFMLQHEGELVMAIPYQRHAHQFRLTPIPQIYSVPRFGGVALIDADCEITHLSPDEAQASEILQGQRYYPYDLARTRVNSMQYVNGILNKWFTHEDQLELADLPGEGNQQPFTVTTQSGITYIVAAEPWGNAAGIYQLWTIDARTGEMARFRTDVQNALLGPRKAANFVEQDNPRVNWNSMSPSEPLPVVRNGTLYWQVRVVPDSSAGVTYTAFVNADTSDVIRYEDDARVRAFIAGEAAPGPGANDTDRPTAGMVVYVLDEDGNVVRRVPIKQNESVRVERTNETVSP